MRDITKCNVSNHMKELTKELTLIVNNLLIMYARFVSDPAEMFVTSASIKTDIYKGWNNAYLRYGF